MKMESPTSESDGKGLNIDSTDLLTAALPKVLEGGTIISKTPTAANYIIDELTTIPSFVRFLLPFFCSKQLSYHYSTEIPLRSSVGTSTIRLSLSSKLLPCGVQ